MRRPPWTHERRRALRVDVPARALVDARRTDVDDTVRLRQVSTSGMLVEGTAALEPDSACDIRLAVAGHPPLALAGRVVYSRADLGLDANARVRFVTALSLERVTPDDAATLASIVAALASGRVQTGEQES